MRRGRAAANRSRAVAAAASDSALQVPRCGALIAPRHHSKATARQRHSGLSSVAMTDERKQCGKHFALRAIAPLTICLSRSEEHTSELQSLMRISYAVFCLKIIHLHISTHRLISITPKYSIDQLYLHIYN